MRISIEYEALGDGTAAIEVDGARIAYVRPNGDGTVQITVVAYNDDGYSPIRQPSFKANVAAVKRRNAKERAR